jgi:hypothetical protein
VSETVRRLHRLGSPHTRARALAVLVAGAGAALATAAAGLWLAPHVVGVIAAWIGVVVVLAAASLLAWRAIRRVETPSLARAAEVAAGARAGSIAALVAAPDAPLPGSSAALFDIADRRAAEAVAGVTPQLSRALRRTATRRLGLGVASVVAGTALFLAAAPTGARAAGFWHPWRTLARARAPLRLAVDRLSVRRGDTVTATIAVPGASSGRVTLWTRQPGEPWRPMVLGLDSSGIAIRRLGPLDTDLWARASQGARRSEEIRIAVATEAFLADLTVVARFPAYLNRAEEPIPVGPDTITLPAGTELVSRGLTSVRLSTASWVAIPGGTHAPLHVDGARFDGRFVPRRGGVWRLTLTAADGAPFEAEPSLLVLRLSPDGAPIVSVPLPGRDTTLPFSMVQPLVIDVHDDHGVGRVALVSWRASQTGAVGAAVRESHDDTGAGDRVIHQAGLRAERRGLMPGDT